MIIRNKYGVEAIAFSSYVLFAMAWVGGNANMAEIMNAMNVNSLAKASLLSSSVAFAKIIGTFIAAGIAIKFGLKAAFLISAIMITLGAITPHSPSYDILLISRFIVGLGGALMIVYFNPIVLKWFDATERPIINGINAVAFNIGSTITLWFIDDLNILLGGWKNTLVAFSMTSLALSVLWLFVDHDGSTHHKQLDKADSASEKPYGYIQGITDPFNWRFSLAYSGILALYLCLITFSSSAGIDQTKWVMSFGIIGSIIGMIYSQRFPERIPIIRISGLGIVLATSGLLFGHSVILTNLCGMGLGFFMFFPIAALVTMPQELPGMNAQRITVVFSLFYFISYSVATLSLWAFGKIVDKNDGEFVQAFIFVTAISSTFLIGSFFLPETAQKSNSKPL